MNYKQANDRLHADPALKERTVAAAEGRAAQGRRKRWAVRGGALVAAVLAVALALRLPLPGIGGNGLVAYAVSQAEYPAMVPCPNEAEYLNSVTGEFDDEGYSQAYQAWWQSKQALQGEPLDQIFLSALDRFSRSSLRQLLGEAGTENMVYSPASLYVALAMLAELTEGETRRQVLEVLGVDELERLREETHSLWQRLYSDDGMLTTRLASALWLDEDVTYRKDTLNTLSQAYFASSYQGAMGTEELNEALRQWLNQQTGNLLTDSVDGISTRAETVMMLLTTVYFQGRWSSEFRPEDTAPGRFTNADGSQIETDFMHKTGQQTYAWGEGFSAVSLSFDGGVSMLLMLPDEGVAVDDLLANDDAMALLTGSQSLYDREEQRYLKVILSMPKFDMWSDLELTDCLKAMGVTDAFDPTQSDFSTMTGLTPVWVDQVKHAARVTVDEEGCTAAAYTMMAMAGSSAPPEDEVEFTLDRPFLFAITGVDGLPLFVGAVNQLMGQ